MPRAARFVAAYGLRSHRTLTEDEAGRDDGSNVAGISHAMVAERYAAWRLVVGTDSHTPHSGLDRCVAFGVGTTDMANAFVTGAVRLTLPEVHAWTSTGGSPGVSAGPGAAPAGAPRPEGRLQVWGRCSSSAGRRWADVPTSRRR